MIYLGFNHPYKKFRFHIFRHISEKLFVYSVITLYQMQGPHKLVQGAISLTCITEVPGSNFGKNTW
jgi:hypothetical protein